LKNFVVGGSGQGGYQYAVSLNGKIVSTDSVFSFPPGERTYFIQVKKYGDFIYEDKLSNQATFTLQYMNTISSLYKTSFTLSNGTMVTDFSNQSIPSMLSYIREIGDASLISEYTEQIVEQVFEKTNSTQFMIYSTTLPFGAATNTIFLKPNFAHVLESMVDSAFMPRWASSGSISFPTKLDFLQVSISSGKTLNVFSKNANGIIKTLSFGESFVIEEKYLIRAGSIYIERIPDPKNCPIPAIPIDKSNLTQKQRYAGFVRKTPYKQVVVGPASNINIYEITNSYFSFSFDVLGSPVEYIYSIKDNTPNHNVTKYTVASNAGETFTFNGLAPNSTYYLEIFVKYASIFQSFEILNAIIVNTLNEIEIKDFSYVTQNNSITVAFDQPENKPGKYVIRYKELLDTSISGSIEIKNVYFKDFYGRKTAQIENLKIGVPYDIYIDTYFTYSDGNYKEPLASPSKTILTIFESSLDVRTTIITGNSIVLQFIDNPNTATQPTNYYLKLTKMGLTEEGKLIEISIINIYDADVNVSRAITGLEKNTRYNIFTRIRYVSGNEYIDATPYFYTRNEGPITNFLYNMYNTFGTLNFDAPPFSEGSTSTVDISFGSLHYTLSGDVTTFSVSNLAIGTAYSIHMRTTYNQTNVYDFFGVFNTLDEGPCDDISFLDINAFDVDCSFSDRFSPEYYHITRTAPDGQTRTLTIFTKQHFQFVQLLHFTDYLITIESVFANRHSYSISRSFRTKNEGPLPNLYSFQYLSTLYLFVDFSSNSFTDMSNEVILGSPLSRYPFKIQIDMNL